MGSHIVTPTIFCFLFQIVGFCPTFLKYFGQIVGVLYHIRGGVWAISIRLVKWNNPVHIDKRHKQGRSCRAVGSEPLAASSKNLMILAAARGEPWRMKWNDPVRIDKRCGQGRSFHYFLLHSFGVTQVPVALATTIGSSRKSAAEALMSGLAWTTFLASNFIFLEVLPTLVISP